MASGRKSPDSAADSDSSARMANRMANSDLANSLGKQEAQKKKKRKRKREKGWFNKLNRFDFYYLPAWMAGPKSNAYLSGLNGPGNGYYYGAGLEDYTVQWTQQ